MRASHPGRMAILHGGRLAESPVVLVAYVLGAAGPLVAVGVTLARRPREDRRRFAARVLDPRRVAPRWWVVVAGVMTLPPAAAAAALGPGPEAGALALPGVVAFALVAGLVEEPRWRGVLIDWTHGGRGRPGMLAIAVGAAWALWHLPLDGVSGTFQHDDGMGSTAFWAYTLALLPESVVLVWLVAGSSGGIVAAVVAHALGNTMGEALDLSAGAQWVRAGVTILAAAALVALVRPPPPPAPITARRAPRRSATGRGRPRARWSPPGDSPSASGR